MWKIKIAVLLLGVAALGWAYQEYVLFERASQPREVTLASLENKPGTDIALRLDGHTALYGLMFYNPANDADANNLGPETDVANVYYPIISSSHPYQQALAALENKTGSRENIRRADYPALVAFAVLVKTSRFKKFKDIPDGWWQEAGVQGLLINRIETDFNKKIIKKRFPGIDPEKLLILEENRKPTSIVIILGAAGVGMILVLIGMLWLYLGWRDRGGY